MTKERKYILIIGVILLAAGLVYRLMPESGPSLQDDLAVKQEKLAKYREVAAQRASVEAELAALQEQLKQAEEGLSSGDTPALASADIQNIISKIAEKSHAEISAVRVLKAEKAESEEYLKLPIQLTLMSNTRQLKDMLYEIEASPKILKVAEMSVRVIRTKPDEQLQTTMTINGYMKKGKEGTTG